MCIRDRYLPNLQEGMSWFQSILIKGYNPNVVRGAFINRILGTLGVQSIVSINFVFNTSLRSLQVNFQVQTNLGLLSDQFLLPLTTPPNWNGAQSVSYTHLDVYKRQARSSGPARGTPHATELMPSNNYNFFNDPTVSTASPTVTTFLLYGDGASRPVWRGSTGETDPNSGLAFIAFDAIVSVTHEGENQVTEYPVESGSNVTDLSRPRPRKLTISGIITDAPVNQLWGCLLYTSRCV